MLANNLTLDEEEAVQDELKQLEAEAVRHFLLSESSVLNSYIIAWSNGGTAAITTSPNDGTRSRITDM